MWGGHDQFMVVLYVFWFPQKLVFCFFLSLTGTKINSEITGAALASCLAKAEKLATLK